MSYWYVAHDDELLLDLDDYMRPTKTGCPWGEAFFRRRLRNAMAAGKLKVSEVWLVRSTSERHFHAIVRTSSFINRSDLAAQVSRLIWQLHLGSDLYRGRADLMRAVRGFPCASLLIRDEPIPNFYRKPDAQCDCTKKHSTEEQFNIVNSGGIACPVFQQLRGVSPWELFGPSSKESEKFIPLPAGRVPLELVMSKFIEGEENGTSG